VRSGQACLAGVAVVGQVALSRAGVWRGFRLVQWRCRSSERHPQAAIDRPSFERGPRVDGPAAIGRAVGAQERVPAALTYAGQVLAVDEDAQRAELAFDQQAENDVGLAGRRIRVLDETLAASEVQLDAGAADVFALPHA